jgi:hypothetical protein
MNIELFFNFLNSIGIPINENSPPIFIFACSIFALGTLCLINFINIVMYITVIYISEHEFLVSKVSNKALLLKYINFYKNIRLLYLVLDIAFFSYDV